MPSAEFPPRDGLRYGALGFALAFVALPLYVILPNHYASEFGIPLATLGALLLGIWVLGAALRVGRVAHDLRAVLALPGGLFAGPGPHGQRVGAAGE